MWRWKEAAVKIPVSGVWSLEHSTTHRQAQKETNTYTHKQSEAKDRERGGWLALKQIRFARGNTFSPAYVFSLYVLLKCIHVCILYNKGLRMCWRTGVPTYFILANMSVSCILNNNTQMCSHTMHWSQCYKDNKVRPSIIFIFPQQTKSAKTRKITPCRWNMVFITFKPQHRNQRGETELPFFLDWKSTKWIGAAMISFCIAMTNTQKWREGEKENDSDTWKRHKRGHKTN